MTEKKSKLLYLRNQAWKKDIIETKNVNELIIHKYPNIRLH